MNRNIDISFSTPIFSNEEDEGQGDVSTIVKRRVKRPSQYKVLLHNDDYTTMEFVIFVLQKFFGKSVYGRL